MVSRLERNNPNQLHVSLTGPAGHSPEMEHCMARKNHTVINPSDVRAIAAKLGLNIKDKKGEFKVYGDSIKRSIACPNTKNGATRIYLVGFEASEGTVVHPKPPATTVTQMFDHSLDKKLILRAIFKAAKQLVVKPETKPAPSEVVVEEAVTPVAEPVAA